MSEGDDAVTIAHTADEDTLDFRCGVGVDGDVSEGTAHHVTLEEGEVRAETLHETSIWLGVRVLPCLDDDLLPLREGLHPAFVLFVEGGVEDAADD